MKRSTWLVMALVIGLSLPALAGGDHKCTYETQECLDMMASSMKKTGYVGLDLAENDEGGWAVTEVLPDSPAKAAGFRTGDVLIAMKRIQLGEENKDALKAEKEKLSPGTQVTYTVNRNGKTLDLTATLAPVPADVLARFVGQHLLEHATTEVAQN